MMKKKTIWNDFYYYLTFLVGIFIKLQLFKTKSVTKIEIIFFF